MKGTLEGRSAAPGRARHDLLIVPPDCSLVVDRQGFIYIQRPFVTFRISIPNVSASPRADGLGVWRMARVRKPFCAKTLWPMRFLRFPSKTGTMIRQNRQACTGRDARHRNSPTSPSLPWRFRRGLVLDLPATNYGSICPTD